MADTSTETVSLNLEGDFAAQALGERLTALQASVLFDGQIAGEKSLVLDVLIPALSTLPRRRHHRLRWRPSALARG